MHVLLERVVRREKNGHPERNCSGGIRAKGPAANSHRQPAATVLGGGKFGIPLRQLDRKLDRLANQRFNEPRANSHLLPLVSTSMRVPSVRMVTVPNWSVRMISAPTRLSA